MLSLLSGSLVLALSIPLIVIVAVPGCVNDRLIELQSGQSCSAEKVRQYAEAHSMTYEQALEECRRRDQADWDAEEAKQARLNPSAPAGSSPGAATAVPELTPSPSTSREAAL
jgi:hypothetical protein